MQSLARNKWHVPYVSLYQAVCDGDSCIEYADGEHRVPLLRDGDHLTEEGSGLVARRLIARGELHWSDEVFIVNLAVPWHGYLYELIQKIVALGF